MPLSTKGSWRPLVDSMPTELSCVPREIPSHFKNKDVIAIGDVHGDLVALLTTLHSANVINEKGEWTCDDKIVVLCGDVVDRGGRGKKEQDEDVFEERKLLCYICNMNKNRRGNWMIYLIGNHELMRVTGKRKYIGNQRVFDDHTLISYLAHSARACVTVENTDKMCVFCHTLPDQEDFVHRADSMLPGSLTGAEKMNAMLRQFLADPGSERTYHMYGLLKEFTWGRHVAELECRHIKYMENVLWWLHGGKVENCQPYVAIGHTNSMDRLSAEMRCSMVVLLDVRLSSGFSNNGRGYLSFPARRPKPFVM